VRVLLNVPVRVPSVVWESVITGAEVTELQQMPRAVTLAPP
jgi:hypothetical protein